MQLAFGTVVDGKIVVVGDPLPEGARVTVLIREQNEVFEVPPEMEAELQLALGEADRGETFSMDDKQLRISELLRFAEDLGEGVADEAASPRQPTQAERAEWQRRLAEHHLDPASSIPWDTLRAELFQRAR